MCTTKPVTKLFTFCSNKNIAQNAPKCHYDVIHIVNLKSNSALLYNKGYKF